MMNRLLISFALLFFCYTKLQAQAPKSYTQSEVQQELKRLSTRGSVLYIAAHPDDENTRLISWLANERCLRTGYLSLTRGDGGQNLIGSEQGIELGVIRTQELLAARRTDGGEQFFTRAFDFGYSKSPKETFEKWNHDAILADVVFVIRKFRPDVIITRFATDGSGGHGHHTASAMLAEEAFDAAADPSRFPEQLQYVEVWQCKRLFYNNAAKFWNPNADMSGNIKIDVGGFNALLGKNYGEIAAESRSMHRSQGFGSSKQRGEMFEYFKPIKGDTAGLVDLFDRIDLTWNAAPNGKKINALLSKAMAEYSKGNIANCNKALFETLQLFPPGELENPLYQYKRYQLHKTILMVNGIFLEAVAEGSALAAVGDSVKIKVISINRSKTAVTLNQLSLMETGYMSNNNNECGTGIAETALNKEMTYNVPRQDYFNRIICTSNMPGEMFWLEKEIENNKFSLAQQDIGKAYGIKSGYMVNWVITIQGMKLNWVDAVKYKWTDPEKGENYRPYIITPPVLIQVPSPVLVTRDTLVKEVHVKLKAGKDNVSGNLKAILPEGWICKNEGTQAFALSKKGEEKEYVFLIKAPNQNSKGTLRFEAGLAGNVYTKGIKEIAYDHIPTQTLFPEARMQLVKLEAQKKSKKIGYIPGAGDEVPACLSQMGYEVITITDAMLANESLYGYDAIITGVRAFNVNDKLTLLKPKLMDYVNNGGNLIIQYNTNSFAGPFKGDVGPYPFKITRERITDEHAQVVFENKQHAVFNTPNKLSEQDFEGWVQERSIYHAGDWDAHYEAPMSMADPGEKSNNGALILCKYGKGNFVYTGLVFFRELPAGVPGAYKLMINLIELGK